MINTDDKAFIFLFKQAFQKCFGFALTMPISETESKLFSNKVFEDTGLVIGAKSLKNYSFYVVNHAESKKENPSVATLDTLARYVLHAPYSDEVQRKDKENHYPYWFQFKSASVLPGKKKLYIKRYRWVYFIIAAIILIAFLIIIILFRPDTNEKFVDNFHALQEDSLMSKGWIIKSKDIEWWKKRNEKPSCLTLYTLRGDNWPDSQNMPAIKNLMLKKSSAACFIAEIHLDNFQPKNDWQQAGLLLMEDTSLNSKTVRLSIAYNDFFGGFDKPKEIIIQAISSGGKDFTKPEEIAHIPIFSIKPGEDTLVNRNLKYSALRIEKTNNHFRFLYSVSPVANFALKEAFSKDLTINPKYIGIFALKGFVNDTNYIPARFTYFLLSNTGCE